MTLEDDHERMNSEHVRIWKEKIVAYFNIVSWHLPEETEEGKSVKEYLLLLLHIDLLVDSCAICI
jgi:hypothetical protein